MNHDWKLYRDGSFFDLTKDLNEERALDSSRLSAEAGAARTALQKVLDQYREARPAAVKEPGKPEKPRKPKKP